MGSRIQAIHFMLLMFEAALAFCHNERENERLDWWALSLGNCLLSQATTPVQFHVIFWTLRAPIPDFFLCVLVLANSDISLQIK